MNKQIQSELISTSVGLLTIAGLSILNTPLIISGTAALGLYLGLKLIISPPNNKLLIKLDSLPNEVALRIKDTDKLLKNIHLLNKDISSKDINEEITKIVELGYKLIEVLSDEANASTLLRDVQKLYSSLYQIMIKYMNLKNHERHDYPKQTQLFNDFEKVLHKINIALEEYYKKGIKSDLQSFEVDLKVVESKIDQSGNQ